MNRTDHHHSRLLELGFTVFILLLLLAAFRIHQQSDRFVPVYRVSSSAPSLMKSEPLHFRHAVVYNGIHSQDDLARVIATDPLAAKHYAGFTVENARTVRLPYNLIAFASYRKNGGIFWTKKPLIIPAGEELLTDGINYIRERCGNRLSLTPAEPTESVDPGDTELIEPRAEDKAVQTYSYLSDPLSFESSLPLFVPTGVEETYAPTSGFLFVPLGGGGVVNNDVPRGTAPLIVGTDPLPTPTPEPETGALIFVGILGIGMVAAIKKADRDWAHDSPTKKPLPR